MKKVGITIPTIGKIRHHNTWKKKKIGITQYFQLVKLGATITRKRKW